MKTHYEAIKAAEYNRAIGNPQTVVIQKVKHDWNEVIVLGYFCQCEGEFEAEANYNRYRKSPITIIRMEDDICDMDGHLEAYHEHLNIIHQMEGEQRLERQYECFLEDGGIW